MSDESASGDASAEVERIRALWSGVFVDGADRERKGEADCCAWWECPGAEPSETVEARWWDEPGRERALNAPAHVATLLAALDRVTAERDAYKRAKAENDERFMTERDQARAERDALAARLPSPESVTRARLVAAEIVEVATALVASNETDWRAIANNIAAHIRDRARTHSGTHDEGGDVDERELLWCASRVDRCTTLGELEALVREWREVA